VSVFFYIVLSRDAYIRSAVYSVQMCLFVSLLLRRTRLLRLNGCIHCQKSMLERLSLCLGWTTRSSATDVARSVLCVCVSGG